MKEKPFLFSPILLIFCLQVFLRGAMPLCAQNLATLRKKNPPENAIWLEALYPELAKTTGGNLFNAFPIMLGGLGFRHGITTAPGNFLVVNLKGAAEKFAAAVGIDDLGSGGAVIFEVWVDGKKAAGTDAMKIGDKPQVLSVDVTGAKKLVLMAHSVETGYYTADWGGAMLTLKPGAKDTPEAPEALNDPAPEIASGEPPEPKIHGARIVGGTPGHAFQFLIPATGEAPLSYSAKNLPAGLSLDAKTGIISGTLKKEGKFIVEVTVKNSRGTAKRKLTIVAGIHKLALTPPMGWNSWNVWGTAVDAGKVKAAADAMVKSGLSAHGYQFINIDDGWEKGRGANGEILTNEKFPDMKALADYVHTNGLKLGIYSSPGPKTCAGYEGSLNHEFQDAKTYAEWNVDYLKYDWCTYSAKDNSLAELQKPYALMRKALDACRRDIVYSLCQYGMGDVWKWGAEVGGNLWRTTGDINDSWGSMAGIGFSQNGLEKYAALGHWNDPDMLVVGNVGWGPALHPTKLTPNQQLTHITLWAILAAPMLIGCDMSNMDKFTMDLLTNSEVIDVNQDPLGKQGFRVLQDGLSEVWMRPLYDGTAAVALFNRYFEKQEITAKWKDLGIKGAHPVRNLWQKKDLGNFSDSFTTSVPAYGAVLVRIGKAKIKD